MSQAANQGHREAQNHTGRITQRWTDGWMQRADQGRRIDQRRIVTTATSEDKHREEREER